jgi:hypothetical protein
MRAGTNDATLDREVFQALTLWDSAAPHDRNWVWPVSRLGRTSTIGTCTPRSSSPSSRYACARGTIASTTDGEVNG